MSFTQIKNQWNRTIGVWCKLEHWFCTSVSAIVDAENSCSHIKGTDNKITASLSEHFLHFWDQNFPMPVSQFPHLLSGDFDWRTNCIKDHQPHAGDHHPNITQIFDWFLFQKQIQRTDRPVGVCVCS